MRPDFLGRVPLQVSGLAIRMMGFLSLALLPIGLVAYLQNARLAEETRARSELSLTALTTAAASSERRAILRAQGGATALAAAIDAQGGAPDTCRSILSAYLASSDGYTFAGVIPPGGLMTCSSNGSVRDFSGGEGFRKLMANPRPHVNLNPDPPISNQPVLIVSQPFNVSGAFAGFISLSIPSALLREEERGDLPDDVFLLTFNADGELLSSRQQMERITPYLPDSINLRELTGGPAHSFAAQDSSGRNHVYVVAPLVDNMVYALTIWPFDNGRVEPFQRTGLAGALPFAMWGASVIVAFLAVNGLVIRPMRQLGRRMRLFARSRTLPRASLTEGLPTELQEMEQDFLDMAHGILRDEAAQENALREKTILLREVHHRVKNNLQLISSIMNMQIRNATNPETRTLLQGLQDRVRSLATVHRSLYETENLGRIDTGALLEELVGQFRQMSDGRTVSFHSRISPVEMLPDQVVPLSLLVSEAVTNALKHAAPDANGHTWIALDFGPARDSTAELEVRNSRDPSVPADHATQNTGGGIGRRLIQAFATQLGGTLDEGAESDCYRLRLRFHVETSHRVEAA